MVLPSACANAVRCRPLCANVAPLNPQTAHEWLFQQEELGLPREGSNLFERLQQHLNEGEAPREVAPTEVAARVPNPNSSPSPSPSPLTLTQVRRVALSLPLPHPYPYPSNPIALALAPSSTLSLSSTPLSMTHSLALSLHSAHPLSCRFLAGLSESFPTRCGRSCNMQILYQNGLKIVEKISRGCAPDPLTPGQVRGVPEGCRRAVVWDAARCR